MNIPHLRMVVAGLCFVFIFIFGFWLSRFGKPYGFLVFTIHKLIALGVVAFLAVTIYKAQLIFPLSPLHITAIGITGLCFVLTIITGSLLSIDKAMPMIVRRLHQITPYLTVLSTAGSLYLTRVNLR